MPFTCMFVVLPAYHSCPSAFALPVASCVPSFVHASSVCQELTSSSMLGQAGRERERMFQSCDISPNGTNWLNLCSRISQPWRYWQDPRLPDPCCRASSQESASWNRSAHRGALTQLGIVNMRTATHERCGFGRRMKLKFSSQPADRCHSTHSPNSARHWQQRSSWTKQFRFFHVFPSVLCV